MNLDFTNIKSINKTDIEQVQDQKKEYAILGTYVLKKGYKTYSYSWQKDEIKEVVITKGDYLQTGFTKEEGFICFDPENLKATIDSNLEYFQSLNLDMARKYVLKCKKNNKPIFNLKLHDNKRLEMLKNLF